MTETAQKPRAEEPNGASSAMALEEERGDNAEEKLPASERQHKRTPVAGADAKDGKSKSPKKRRKVNHACIYCRRSHMTCDLERPCTRCIKRDIGHLCHDEPREPIKKSSKTDLATSGDDAAATKLEHTPETSIHAMETSQTPQDSNLTLGPPPLPQNRLTPSGAVVQPNAAGQVPALGNANSSYLGFNDWSLGAHTHFQDMHTFHPSYMFNASEVTNEYNVLNDFLSSSLLDDGAMYAGEELRGIFSDPSFTNNMNDNLPSNRAGFAAGGQQNQLAPPSQAAVGSSISRPPSIFPSDKAQERYYLTAADPAGTDTAEERLNKLLKAKYDAGLLKPFNHVKGYQRLNQYMEKHIQPSSRQRILRQIDKFRPKFRERISHLTDIELVLVEMWFERSLMEYDRVFASMAIPACCWRRTGEIFRGNKEMAELIHVPIEQLREGKISLHDILVEASLVNYWDKFGAIAFDSSQKAILTSCSLKNPDPSSKDKELKCCFSFTIRRDTHNIPSLIVGNFLPMMPASTD